MLGQAAAPAPQAKIAGSIPLAAALERDPVAVLLSAPKRAAQKNKITDRSWAVFFFACQISAVFRVLRALRKQKSETEVARALSCSGLLSVPKVLAIRLVGRAERQGRPRARWEGAGRASPYSEQRATQFSSRSAREKLFQSKPGRAKKKQPTDRQ